MMMNAKIYPDRLIGSGPDFALLVLIFQSLGFPNFPNYEILCISIFEMVDK